MSPLSLRRRHITPALVLAGGLLTARSVVADPPTAASLPRVVDVPSPAMERVTFTEAVRRAVGRNPTLAIAEIEVRRAHAIVEEVRAASLPTLGANAVYTRLDSDRVLNGRVISADNQFGASLTLTVPLVLPQRWVQWSHASEGVDIARVTEADVRRTVAANVGHAYLTVASQHRIIATLERARDNAREHLNFAHARFAGGIGTRIDEVRAAEEAATDELQIATQRLSLARQQAALGVLMGLDHGIDAVDDAVVDPAPAERDALNGAEHRRADVLASERRLRAAEHIRDDSWVDFLPSLLGVVQPFYQNPPTLTQPELGWQAQLLLSVPLYDGGLRYGARHEREALADEARLGLDALLMQARAEVRTAYESLRQAEVAAVAAHASRTLAEEALSLAVQAYRAGASTNIEVIDAERRARDAAATGNMADDTVRQARLDLLLAAGAFP